MFVKLVLAAILAVCAAEPELDFQCPAEGIHFFRYPYDCSKFIECNNGVVKVTDCIPGFQFSTRTSYCDFPDNVECVVEDEPQEAAASCPSTNGPFAAYLPHESDCNKFYECDWGRKILMSCPAGLHFNIKSNVCDYPASAGCVQTEKSGCPATNGEFAAYLPHESDCTKFYECDWGKMILMSCPPGLYFNAELDVCDYQELSGCVQN